MSRRGPFTAERLLTLVVGRERPPEGGGQRCDELAALARSVVLGDKAAVRTFLVTVGPVLLRVVRKVLGPTHAEVEDVAQECALAVVDALPRYRGECTVLHFSCRVAVMTAMNVRRRESAQKRPSGRSDDVGLEELPSSLPGPEADLSAKTSLRLVRDLLDTLPLPQAEVLALHCVLGYTVTEIAEACGVPSETVRSRLRLSRQALRERILADPSIREAIEELS